MKKAKYIQFWGTDKSEFLDIMNHHSIFQIDDLNFIDEYPLVTEALSMHNQNIVPTDVLITKLRDLFCGDNPES